MKTARLALLMMLWIGNGSLVFAQTPAGAGLAAPGGAEQIGVASAVRGGVQLERSGRVGSVVTSGEPVYLGDVVSTDAGGALQILLLDQTAFTIGPNSSMVIDRFVYDPATETGKVGARVVKGTFRFVTGKIARKNPEDMEVALPSGTIGIRGTMAMGSVTGDESLVVLTGPGKQNNTGNKAGELIVSNEAQSVHLTKTGFGSEIQGRGKPPSDPFQVPETVLQQLTQSLSPQGGGSGEEGGEDSGSATESAGQDTADAGEDSSEAASVGDLSQGLADESSVASQKASENTGIQDGIAKVRDLLTVETGKFFYNYNDIPLFPPGGGQQGEYDFNFDIDFGARRVGGGNSRVTGNSSTINGGADFRFNLPAQNFENGSAQAIYTYSNIADTLCSSGQCKADVKVTLNNSGGVVAENADVTATIREFANTVSGTGNAERFSGSSAP